MVAIFKHEEEVTNIELQYKFEKDWIKNKNADIFQILS